MVSQMCHVFGSIVCVKASRALAIPNTPSTGACLFTTVKVEGLFDQKHGSFKPNLEGGNGQGQKPNGREQLLAFYCLGCTYSDSNKDYKLKTTWRIIPVSKWLITMDSRSPKYGYSHSKWPKWLIYINGGY